MLMSGCSGTTEGPETQAPTDHEGEIGVESPLLLGDFTWGSESTGSRLIGNVDILDGCLVARPEDSQPLLLIFPAEGTTWQSDKLTVLTSQGAWSVGDEVDFMGDRAGLDHGGNCEHLKAFEVKGVTPADFDSQ